MLKRRPFLKLTACGLAILGVVLVKPARAAELSPEHQIRANYFIKKYNEWMAFHNAGGPGVVDVREVRAWHEVVKAWHQLEKGTRYE